MAAIQAVLVVDREEVRVAVVRRAEESDKWFGLRRVAVVLGESVSWAVIELAEEVGAVVQVGTAAVSEMTGAAVREE